MVTIYHKLHDKPYYFPDWKVKHLFIGTFDPSGDDNVTNYYGRPRNQIWRLMAALFDDVFDQRSFDDFLKTIQKHGIACVDMIHSITAPESNIRKLTGLGFNDTVIISASVKREYNTAKILELINNNKGVKVYSTWGNGPKLKDWKNEVAKIQPMITLVSPSLAAPVPRGVHKLNYMLADWKGKINLPKR